MMLNRAENLGLINNGKYLWFLLLSFAMVVSISNWYDARLILLFGFTTSPGSLSYPLTFLLSDSITEVYGFKKARLAIWSALFFNVLFLLFGQLVIHLPSPSFAFNNEAFDKLFNLNFWIIFGSFVSFLISEPFNSYILAKLKIFFKGKYIGIRFIFATFIASFFDSAIFTVIAFHTSTSRQQLIYLAINIWVTKVLVEILFLPISIRLTRWLKQKEELDIYDLDTKFNIFSLETDYETKDNFYIKN